MTIVVDEVVISVDVTNEPAPGAPGSSGAGGTESDRQAIISECVERVLEILAEREER